MTNTEIITTIAIIVGPIAAVQVQVLLERAREEKRRKIQVFTTLMATRATPLSPVHVEALNRIDIEFYKDKEVINAWKALLDSFESYPKDINDKDYQRRVEASNEKSLEMRVKLLYVMANALDYEFDEVHLKKGAYWPQWHGWIETEQNVIRSGLAQVFAGKSSFPIYVVNQPNQPEKTSQIEEGPQA